MNEMPPRAKEFWDRARAFTHPDNWAEIVRGSAEHKAWARYFRRQGWMPWGLKMLEIGNLRMIILPTQWPEWFDKDFFGQDRAAAE